MGHLVQMRAVKWSHQKTRLWAAVCSFCQQGRLQLRSVIACYQIVQSGQKCCCFSPGNSWIVLQPQLWLISSSPNKVGQFSFVNHPQLYKLRSAICQAPLWASQSTLTLSICSLPQPHSPRLVQCSTPPPLYLILCIDHCKNSIQFLQSHTLWSRRNHLQRIFSTCCDPTGSCSPFFCTEELPISEKKILFPGDFSGKVLFWDS
jgi:hypothetical protein